MTAWTYERLTGAGRSAVSVYRCDGLTESAWRSLTGLGCPAGESDINRVRLIHFGPEPSEDCVFVRLSESECELHTHGGPAAQARVESLFAVAGGVRNEALSFEQECWDAVTACQTAKLTKWLVGLADGRLKDALERMRHTSVEERRVGLAALVAASEQAMEMTGSPVIAILGRPNAGKSSLMNRIAGYERAIVDPRPGATRDAISIETAIGGFPVTLFDTAGLRETDDPIEADGVRRSLSVAERAVVRLYIIDQSERFDDNDSPFDGAIARGKSLIVRHKADLPDRSGFDWPNTSLSVSSVTGDGLSDLLDAIDHMLAARRPPEDAVFLCSQRQIDVAKSLLAMPEDESLWSRLLLQSATASGDST